MSSIQLEASELREEIARLEESQRQRRMSQLHQREIGQIINECGPDFLKENETRFRDLSPEQIERKLMAFGIAESHRRDLAAVPDKTAAAVATDWRVNMSGVLQTAVGIAVASGVTSLVRKASPRFSSRSDVNPFSDTTAATPRPRHLKSVSANL